MVASDRKNSGKQWKKNLGRVKLRAAIGSSKNVRDPETVT